MTSQQALSDDPNEVRLQKAAAGIGRTLLSQQETKQEASRLLLEGWTMMSETCPITEYPLFRNKKTGQVWSVRLKMPVQTENNGGTSAESSSAIQQQNEVPAQSREDTIVEEPVKASSSQPSKAARRDVSAIIGEKLLWGWELLDEDINGCPLMRDPSNGKKWLPATENYVTEGTSNQPPVSTVPPNTVVSKASANTEMQLQPSGIRKTEFNDDDWDRSDSLEREEDDEISQRLSEKMMMGWSMLYEHCPVTNSCPLLLDPRTGKKWSAALNAYVDIATKESTKPEQPKQSRPTFQESAKPSLQPSSESPCAIVRKNLEAKMIDWSEELLKETDVARCRMLLGAIQEAWQTINNLK